MGENHDASPRDAQCSSVVRRRRDHGTAAPSPSWTVGDLPEIPYRVSTQHLNPSIRSCYLKGGFFFLVTVLSFIFLPVQQLFGEEASALSAFLLCFWSCPSRDPRPGLWLPYHPGPPPQHFWQHQNCSVPWKGYIFLFNNLNVHFVPFHLKIFFNQSSAEYTCAVIILQLSSGIWSHSGYIITWRGDYRVGAPHHGRRKCGSLAWCPSKGIPEFTPLCYSKGCLGNTRTWLSVYQLSQLLPFSGRSLVEIVCFFITSMCLLILKYMRIRKRANIVVNILFFLGWIVGHSNHMDPRLRGSPFKCPTWSTHYGQN